MPTAYDGIVSNIVPTAPLTITSTSVGSPVTVTVSGSLPADFLTTVLVRISGVQGNAGTNVNGIWEATVTGGSTFTIPVSSSGTYSAGGVVSVLNLPPSYTIPSDGDADNAASVFSALSATGDRTGFLAQATGFTKLAGRVVFQQFSHIGLVWATISPTAVLGFNQMTLSPLSVLSMEEGCASANSAAGPYAVDGVYSGDLVKVRLATGYIGTSGFITRVYLYYGTGQPGGAAPAFGSYTVIAGTSCSTGSAYSGGAETPIVCEGWIPHPPTGMVYIQPVIYAPTGGSASISLVNDTQLTVELYRLTGVNQ